jgi:ATP-dependent 26S proteasome regulatory subunit
MYLAGRMADRTTILLTGGGLGLLEESCALARALQPATLILEDVDLVAEERTAQQKACNVVLFELLNQMDGLADDADLLFLLTTNRPEMLETALASRPGRIDQAIEVPLPDSTCRDRLLSLYSDGLTVELADRGKIVERTKGASAAFIRELLRKAALFAADDAGANAIVVRDRHFEDALYELVALGGDMTKSLLGFAPNAPTMR